MSQETILKNYLPIGVIGSGNMGCGIMSGLVTSKLVQPGDIFATNSRYEGLVALKKQGVHLGSNVDTAKNARTIILSVKPNLIVTVIKEILPHLDNGKLIISVAAGVSLKDICAVVNKCPVIRVMPNTAVSIGQGCVAMAGAASVEAIHLNVCKTLFQSVSPVCEEVSEANIDAMIGISGSGIAYMYVVAEALIDAGVKMGLTRIVAKNLASQTMIGAGKMIQETGLHPMVLKDQVTSPGGTTICGVTKLEEMGLRNALIQAAEAARDRAKALTK